MIVVDANYFVRLLVQPVTPHDHQMLQTATTLFHRVAHGVETFTTSDAVIAEVIFALQRHYGLSRADVATRLRPLLRLPGCQLSTKHLCLMAFDLWLSSPNISFVDALCAAHAQHASSSLATFDQALSKISGVPIWYPSADIDDAT